jgi:hypothetical protein
MTKEELDAACDEVDRKFDAWCEEPYQCGSADDAFEAYCCAREEEARLRAEEELAVYNACHVDGDAEPVLEDLPW